MVNYGRHFVLILKFHSKALIADFRLLIYRYWSRRYRLSPIFLTLPTSVLSFFNGGIFSEQKRLTSLYLSVTGPVQDPLAVLLLHNQLDILKIERLDFVRLSKSSTWKGLYEREQVGDIYCWVEQMAALKSVSNWCCVFQPANAYLRIGSHGRKRSKT